MAKIKIDGDVSGLKKSILDITKDVKALGKSKIALFDKDQKDFLSKEAKSHIAGITKELDKNKKEIAGALKLQKQQTKSVAEEVRKREKVTKLVQKQVELQKELQQMQKASSTLSGSGGGMGGGGGFMGKMRGLKGMGGMMGGLSRMAHPLGIAAAVGGFGISRGVKVGGVFKEGMSDRMALRGRGVGDMDLEDRERATGAGLNSQTMRRARLSSMDVFGEKGSTQAAVTQRAEVERNFGIESGTLRGLGGQMRGQMGGEGADKAVMTIQAGLIASGITDEIGPYLETAANMLTALNENGFSFNDSAMAVLNNLTREGVAAERAGKMIGGVDKSIRGSSGEANAFFQEVFRGAGVGGNTVGSLQAGIRSGGLFGADLDKSNLSSTDRAAFGEMGIGGRTGQKVAASTINKLDQMFGTDSDIDKLLNGSDSEQQAGATRRLQRNNFIMNTFGLDNEVQGAEVNKMLKEMADPDTSKKRQKELKDKIKNMSDGNSELGNLKLINKSTAGSWDVLKNLHRSIQDELGGKVAPALMSIDKTLMKIDMALSAMLNFLGIETPQEKLAKALSGEGTLSQKTFDEATMGDASKEREISKKLAEEFTKNQERVNQLREQGADKEWTRTGRGVTGSKSAIELRDLENRNRQISDNFRNVEGLDPTGFMNNNRIRGQFNTQTEKRAREESDKKSAFGYGLFNSEDDYKSPVKRGREGSNAGDDGFSGVLKEIKKSNDIMTFGNNLKKEGNRSYVLSQGTPAKGEKTGI